MRFATTLCVLAIISVINFSGIKAFASTPEQDGSVDSIISDPKLWSNEMAPEPLANKTAPIIKFDLPPLLKPTDNHSLSSTPISEEIKEKGKQLWSDIEKTYAETRKFTHGCNDITPVAAKYITQQMPLSDVKAMLSTTGFYIQTDLQLQHFYNNYGRPFKRPPNKILVAGKKLSESSMATIDIIEPDSGSPNELGKISVCIEVFAQYSEIQLAE